MLMEGNCGIVEPADICEPPLDARSLGAFAASRGGAAWKLGRLVDGRTLRFKETTSVSRVVRLSLKEDDVEGARPESLLASWGSFDRAFGLDGERGCLSRLMALFEGGLDGSVIGIGGSAAVVFSYAMPLKLSSLDLVKGTCCGGKERDAIAPRLELSFNGRGLSHVWRYAIVIGVRSSEGQAPGAMWKLLERVQYGLLEGWLRPETV